MEGNGLIAVIAAVAAVVGGVIGRIFPSADKKLDAETAIRQDMMKMELELRKSLNDEVDSRRELEKELDQFKDRYYKVLEKYNHQLAVNKEQHAEIEKYKQEVKSLTDKINKMGEEIKHLKNES